MNIIKKRKSAAIWVRRILRHLLFYTTPFWGIGILYFLGAKDCIDKNGAWYPILQSLGIALLMSGAISFWASMVNSFDFFSIQLSKIIFGDEFIKHRKDLESVWDKVSRAMYHEKFPEISDMLQRTIKDIYFPTNYFYYTDYYDMTIKFEYVDDQRKYIRLIETSKQKIIAHSNEEFWAPFSNTLNVADNDTAEIKIMHLTVNNRIMIKPEDGKKVNCSMDNGKDLISNGDLKIECYNFENKLGFKGTLRLQGCSEYIIVKQTNKVYQITLNPLKSFSANNIYKKLLVAIDKPKDLFIEFDSMGTPNEFEKILTDNEEERQRYIYRDIVMVKQGFIMGISNSPK